jgi:hypothetical protein
MKKLILILFLIVGNLLIGQTEEQLDDFVNELNSWSKNTKTFKTGDNDRHLMVGLLKDIFTDPSIKYKYAELNPRIGEMMVLGNYVSDSIPYSKWITTLDKYNSEDYKFVYVNNDKDDDEIGSEQLYNESITVYDDNDMALFNIYIIYNGNNLRSILDSREEIYK